MQQTNTYSKQTNNDEEIPGGKNKCHMLKHIHTPRLKKAFFRCKVLFSSLSDPKVKLSKKILAEVAREVKNDQGQIW